MIRHAFAEIWRRRTASIALGFSAWIFALFSATALAENKEWQSRSSPKRLEAVRVQLPWTHQFQFAGLYAAIEKGFFRDVGLDVQLLEGSPSMDPAQPVLSGDVEFGVGGSELMLLRLKGHPVVVLAAIFQRSPSCLLTLGQNGVSSPADLIGKRVMMRGNDRDAEFRALFKHAGVALDQIEWVPQTGNVADLLELKADAMAAYSTTQPYQLRMLGGAPSILRPSAFGVNFYGDCLYTTEQQEDKNPERVAAFREAALKGWNYAIGHRNEVFDWLQTKYAVRRNYTQAALESEALLTTEIILPDLVQLGHLNQTRWQHIAKLYQELGMASTDQFSPRFVFEPARSVLGFWKTAGLWVAIVAVGTIAIAAFWNLRLQLQVAEHRKDLLHEIEERRRAEEALGATREQLEAFLVNCPLAAFFKDENGRLISVNEAFAQKHGHYPEWWIGKHPREYLPPEYMNDIEKNDRAVLESGASRQFHEFLTDPTGAIREWVTWRFPMKTAGGRTLLGGMSLDVTEQRKAEAALRLAEEKYRSIFENSVEGLLQVSVAGSVLTANASAARLLGYDAPKQMVDEVNISESIVLSPREALETIAMLKRGELLNGFEVQMVRRDGSRFWVSASARAVFDGQGTLTHYEGSIEDISERKRLADQLRQGQKMEAIGRLAGGVAHDFNNLLTAILGYSQLTAGGLPHESPLRDHVKQIISATERATELTRQLLTFSRRQAPQRKPLNLNEVVSEMENLLRRLIGEHIDLRTRLNPDLGNILADRTEIGQVVMNLVINARDAMPMGGSIELATQNVTLDASFTHVELNAKPGDYICLIVRDTGCGMSPETLSHIFEPFFTTKSRDQGTGLGLPTVYGIVNHSEGHIEVDSEVGQGTTFRIYLPRAAAPVELNGELPAQLALPDGRERVLVVEDESMLRNLVSELLRRQGYTVIEAGNGEEALEHARQLRGCIDLLLTDVVMPKMNGRELARRFEELHPTAAVLYMSGYTEDAMLCGVESRNLPFLQKPFTSNELASKVREVLDLHRADVSDAAIQESAA